jgi:hypothetical protein
LDSYTIKKPLNSGFLTEKSFGFTSRQNFFLESPTTLRLKQQPSFVPSKIEKELKEPSFMTDY